MGINPYSTHRTTCHSCGGTTLVPILDLGVTPLANRFVYKEDLAQPEPHAPLVLYFCETCKLVQLLDIVNPEILFHTYRYLTSANQPMIEHFTESAREIENVFISSPEDLVVEIGGNDGVLLTPLKNKCRVVNVEPSFNVAQMSLGKGLPTINDFFNEQTAQDILAVDGPAKVIVANNVIAHIEDIKSVMKGVSSLLSDNGVFIFEVHWVGHLIRSGAFDQVYHEHLYYYSVHALQNLLKQFGLYLFNIERVFTHGESLKGYAIKQEVLSQSVQDILEEEKRLGLDKAETFLSFSGRVQHTREVLCNLLTDLKSAGRRIVGYGAPAKSTTLLNTFNIGPDILDYVSDTTPIKQGMFTPGKHILVSHPERLRIDRPDYALLLAWNYKDAILKKEADLRRAGTKFIIPLPDVHIV